MKKAFIMLSVLAFLTLGHAEQSIGVGTTFSKDGFGGLGASYKTGEKVTKGIGVSWGTSNEDEVSGNSFFVSPQIGLKSESDFEFGGILSLGYLSLTPTEESDIEEGFSGFGFGISPYLSKDFGVVSIGLSLPISFANLDYYSTPSINGEITYSVFAIDLSPEIGIDITEGVELNLAVSFPLTQTTEIKASSGGQSESITSHKTGNVSFVIGFTFSL